MVLLLTTSQLTIVLCFRNYKAIKATSPLLSLLIFVGCYLLCFGAVVTVTSQSFITPTVFALSLTSRLVFVMQVNGTNLILVTITIRLLRVYRIFLCTGQHIKLGKCWKNMPLVLIAVSVSLLPNLFLILFIVNQYFIISCPLYSVLVGSIESFSTIFAIATLFLTIRTSRVKHKNFKDTKVI